MGTECKHSKYFIEGFSSRMDKHSALADNPYSFPSPLYLEDEYWDWLEGWKYAHFKLMRDSRRVHIKKEAVRRVAKTNATTQ